MDTDRSGLLGDAADRLLDITGRDHHEIRELVEDDDDVAELASLDRFARRSNAGRDPSLDDGLVEPVDVADAELAQHVVAAFHLPHAPSQRVRGLLRIGHHLGQEVRQALVLRELDPFRVDQDQAHLLRGGAHEQGSEHGVDTARLTRAGLTGDKKVGHVGQVGHHRPAGDVTPERDLERVGRPGGFF